MQAAAKAAHFIRTPRPEGPPGGAWPAGEVWGSGNGGYPLALLISQTGEECVVIMRKADPGSVFALVLILPQVFRQTPGVEVRPTDEADRPGAEVIAFRVKTLPAMPGQADRLVISEPDFKPDAPANLVLTIRLVKGE
jgi:hypothetical protein